jgi:hypothetical protein
MRRSIYKQEHSRGGVSGTLVHTRYSTVLRVYVELRARAALAER